MEDTLESTLQNGKYAENRYLQSFEVKWIHEHHLMIRVTVEPPNRLAKPKRVTLHLHDTEIQQIRDALLEKPVSKAEFLKPRKDK